MKDIFIKIKEFFLKNEQKIVLIVAFCLVSVISYEFGLLQGQKWQQKPLVIEKGINTPVSNQTTQNEASITPENVSSAVLPTQNNSIVSTANCVYVGSKSSTKFYLSTCSWAKSIKPENLVCFKTAEEAIKQGRTESKCH
jgi:hypothetical protein